MIKRVVFMGTPDFAVGTLKALIDSKYEVAAVFSQPDKPKGRGKALQMTPTKEVAVEAGIPVYQPAKIREAQWLSVLEELAPDVIVVVAFGQIIPESILKLPKYGCINVHASLLPKYRGAAPIQWAVIDGEKESGVTTMQMDAGLDTGDMLLKETVALEEKETGGSLFDKLSEVGAQLLIKTLEALENGTVTAQKQPAESPTPYAAMLTKKQGEIDWNQDAKKIECLIRGLNPWPSAYTHWNGKMLKIWMAEPVTQEELSALGCDEKNGMDLKEAQPGTVMIVTKDTLMVQTGDGLLALTELQMEGKKRMPVQAFLMGCRLQTGEKLERIGRY